MSRVLQLGIGIGFLVLFGACESAKFRSENSGGTMPWATPEGFENDGAGTPLGMMGGMQGRR